MLEACNHALPSLHDVCVEAAASGQAWSKQRRSMHRLPESSANQLLQLLLERGQLIRPYQLELFAHCATALSITSAFPQAEVLDKTWVAYLAEFKHLGSLQLEGCPRLTDAPLAAVWRAAPRLTRLSLASCAGLTNACLQGLAHLNQLTTLDLSGCSGLSAPLRLDLLPSSIAHLSLGDVRALDDEAAGVAASALPGLQALTAWGTGVTTMGVQLLAFCMQLQRLDVSWTSVDMIPAISQLTSLQMQHCQVSGVWWPSGEPHTGPPLQLQHLNLHRCSVTAAGTLEVQRFLGAASPGLVWADLRGTHTLTDLTWIETAGSLQQLWLDGPRAGVSVSPLAHAASLRQLHLQGVDLGAEHATWWLTPLTRITCLELLNCNLNDGVLPFIWQLTCLQQLRLDQSHLTGTAPAPHTLPQLLSATTSRQHSSDTIDIWAPEAPVSTATTATPVETGAATPAVGHESDTPTWSSLHALSELSVTGSHLSDVALQQIVTGVTSLRRLRCGSDSLTDAGLRAVSLVDSGIQALDLQDCGRVTGRGVAYLQCWTSLQELSLSGCKLVLPSHVTGAFLSSPSLTGLTLDNKRWHRDTPDAHQWSEPPATPPGTPLGLRPSSAHKPSAKIRIPGSRTPPVMGSSPNQARGFSVSPGVRQYTPGGTGAGGVASGTGSWRAAGTSSSMPNHPRGSTTRSAGPSTNTPPVLSSMVDQRLRYSTPQLLAIKEHTAHTTCSTTELAGHVAHVEEAQMSGATTGAGGPVSEPHPWSGAAGELGLLAEGAP